MTRKDYHLVAATISEFLDDGDNDMLNGIGGVEKLTFMLAAKLSSDNPKFNRAKFLAACGLIDVDEIMAEINAIPTGEVK